MSFTEDIGHCNGEMQSDFSYSHKDIETIAFLIFDEDFMLPNYTTVFDQEIFPMHDTPTSWVGVSIQAAVPSQDPQIPSGIVNSSPLINNDIIDERDYNVPLVPYSEHSDSESDGDEGGTKKVKRRRRCQVDRSTWKDH